jgi:tetratricopeptide (TPR) repeat protein
MPHHPFAGLPRAIVIALLLGCAACGRAASPPRRGDATPYVEHNESCRLALAPLSQGGALADEIHRLQALAQQGGDGGAALEKLGYELAARARLTGDDGLFALAHSAAACLATRPLRQLDAQLLRGHLLHQRHRFRQAEAVARELVAARGNAFDQGLLGDALMEQGKLEDATRAYQRMMDLKPFYQSYTRGAHVRWLKGDVAGAADMMALAVSAASPRDPEAVPWAQTRLAHYWLQQGKRADGARALSAALRARPGYAPALLALGRLRLAEGTRSEAIDLLKEAARANPLPEYQWAFADALRADGKIDAAREVEAVIAREGAQRDPRTYAIYLATRGGAVAQAVGLAERELTSRADVFTLDALAWALRAAGRLDEARTHMARALREGTADARLFLHAGAIAVEAGERKEARRWLRQASSLAHMLLPSERAVLDAARARL